MLCYTYIMKNRSYVMLFFLTVVLFFILGVRYGQRVEQTNKAINYFLSITPTKIPTPSVPLEFKKYILKNCGISFLYPSLLELKSESTGAALLVQKDTSLEIGCDKSNKLLDILQDPNVATAEITFKNKSIRTKTTNQGNVYIFSFINPVQGKTIYTALSKTIYPLFESTLQFVTQ